MAKRPIIYLSAFDDELHTLRDRVAQQLKDMGFDATWLPNFGSPNGEAPYGIDEGDPARMKRLRAALIVRLASAAATIQIVGHHYGRPLPVPDSRFGQVSFTQLEALALSRSFKTAHYLLLGESHPTDADSEQPPILDSFQDGYRKMIRARWPKHCLDSGSLDETDRIIQSLKPSLLRGHQRRLLWIALQLWNLIFICGFIIPHACHDNNGRPEVTEQRPVEYRRAQAEIRALVAHDLADTGLLKPKTEWELVQRYNARLRSIAETHQLSEPDLRRYLRNAALTLLADPKAALTDQENAVRDAGTFLPHRDFEGPGMRPLPASGQKETSAKIDLWIAASQMALDMGRNDWAESFAAWAVSWTDSEHDFPTWSAAKHQRGRAWLYDERPDKALKLFHELLPQRTAKYGADHPDTLQSRMALAIALHDVGLDDEAEKEEQAVLAIQTRVLGKEHPDTLLTRVNLAGLIGHQGRYLEAAEEMRTVLAIQERVLGAGHINALRTRHRLAWELGHDEATHDEALALARQAVEGLSNVLGESHRYVRQARNLIKCLSRPKGMPCGTQPLP